MATTDMKLLGSCPKCGESLASPTLAYAVLGHQECDRCRARFDMPDFERRLWLVNMEQMLTRGLCCSLRSLGHELARAWRLSQAQII